MQAMILGYPRCLRYNLGDGFNIMSLSDKEAQNFLSQFKECWQNTFIIRSMEI